MAVYFDDSYNPSSKKFTLLVLYLRNYDVNELKKLFMNLDNIIRSWKSSLNFNDKVYSKVINEIKSTNVLATNDNRIIELIKIEIKSFLNNCDCIYKKIILENINSNKQQRTYKKAILDTCLSQHYNEAVRYYFDRVNKNFDNKFKKIFESYFRKSINSQNTTDDDIKYELMLTDLINLII